MQRILTYLANIAAIITLRALVSQQALRVYGGLLVLIGCLFGHVALVLLGIACLYFGLASGFHLREQDPKPDSPQADSEQT
jgi:hypothetical protein